MRNHLVETEVLGADLAPSYYLECLLYNVPDSLYLPLIKTHSDVFVHAINWLQQADLRFFVCQNGILPMFPEGAHKYGIASNYWDVAKAKQFIDEAIKLWNSWGKF